MCFKYGLTWLHRTGFSRETEPIVVTHSLFLSFSLSLYKRRCILETRLHTCGCQEAPLSAMYQLRTRKPDGVVPSEPKVWEAGFTGLRPGAREMRNQKHWYLRVGWDQRSSSRKEKYHPSSTFLFCLAPSWLGHAHPWVMQDLFSQSTDWNADISPKHPPRRTCKDVPPPARAPLSPLKLPHEISQHSDYDTPVGFRNGSGSKECVNYLMKDWVPVVGPSGRNKGW